MLIEEHGQCNQYVAASGEFQDLHGLPNLHSAEPEFALSVYVSLPGEQHAMTNHR